MIDDKKQAIINRIKELQKELFENEDYKNSEMYLSLIRELVEYDTKLAVEATAMIISSNAYYESPHLFEEATKILISYNEIAKNYTEHFVNFITYLFQREVPPMGTFGELLSILVRINPEDAKGIAWEYSDFESWSRDEEDWGESIRASCFKTLMNLGEMDVERLAYILRNENSEYIRDKAIKAISEINNKKEIPNLYLLVTGYSNYFYKWGRGDSYDSGFKHYPELEKAVLNAFKNIGETLNYKTVIITLLDYCFENDILDSNNYIWLIAKLTQKYDINPNEIINIFLDKKLADKEIRYFLEIVFAKGKPNSPYSDEIAVKMLEKLPDASAIYGVFNLYIDFSNRDKDKMKNALLNALNKGSVYKDFILRWLYTLGHTEAIVLSLEEELNSVIDPIQRYKIVKKIENYSGKIQLSHNLELLSINNLSVLESILRKLLLLSDESEIRIETLRKLEELKNSSINELIDKLIKKAKFSPYKSEEFRQASKLIEYLGGMETLQKVYDYRKKKSETSDK
ncbi:MAG: hypothetical protein GPJ52_04255 [Candidatus Heimdallarchaeota archaeon]|nr:hypothetical protein [Candidatus Heimdallarchaeota archaeon]